MTPSRAGQPGQPSQRAGQHPQRPGRAPINAGVRIAGTGSQLPSKKLTNADLEKMMDTTDEWILQRTGIRERHIIDKQKGESTSGLAAAALAKALAAARLAPTELDLIICATMTAEMPCPTAACLIAHKLSAGPIGAMDLNGACSGFVFGLNIAHDLIRAGSHRAIGLIGADTLSEHMNYTTAGRGTSIIFGDGAGAVVLRACDDPALGLLAQAMHTDGHGWKDIYIPQLPRDFPPGVEPDAAHINLVQMNGAAVFRFAVTTFSNLIQETLDKAGLAPEQVDLYICHQSNARILESARERFGIPADKLYVNIDRIGNTVAASVPLCLDELVQSGRVQPGMKVLFVAFGGGLTWGSSLWQL